MEIKIGLKVAMLTIAAVVLSGCADKNDTTQQEQVISTAQVLDVPKVKIIKWGPQSIVAGETFSTQPNGDSAIWFEQSGIGNANMVEVWFDGTKLNGMAITPNVGGSAQIPPALLAKPGKFPIYLVLKPSGQKVELGTFEIKEKMK